VQHTLHVFPPPRKLTAEQERELTRQYAETSTPIADIARTFSLSEVSVGRIAQRNGAASRRRRAVRDTAPEAPAVPLGVRRGRRRRADADREAIQEPGGDSRGRQPRADGSGAPPPGAAEQCQQLATRPMSQRCPRQSRRPRWRAVEHDGTIASASSRKRWLKPTTCARRWAKLRRSTRQTSRA